jgi:hypothetical protein
VRRLTPCLLRSASTSGFTALSANTNLGSFKRSFCSWVSRVGSRRIFVSAISNHPSSLSPSGRRPWSCPPGRRPWSRGWSTPSGCWPWRATPRHHSPRPTWGSWRRAGSPHWAWPSWPLAVAEDTLYVLRAEGSHNTFNGWHHQLDCRSKSWVHPRPSWPPGPSRASRWRRWWSQWSWWSWWGRPTRWHHYHISTHPSSSLSRTCQ